ncbi:MAG: twin-arginine translocation signal domain-containing protein, partial [Burkholderiaceae bacterium]
MVQRRINSSAGQASPALINSLARGLSTALGTMDRRTFLKRSGVTAGVGAL